MTVNGPLCDKRELKKFLKECTNLPVFEAKCISMTSFNQFITITDEALKNETHITYYQGSWHCEEGGTYKICIYTPTIGGRTNIPYLQEIVSKIAKALDERFGSDNWNECNKSLIERWRPLSRFQFYIEIPNFKQNHNTGRFIKLRK